MARIRTDVASLGPVWNPTMEWYARAVGEMQKRPITDRTSWLYFAAIHGRPLEKNHPLTPEQKRMWNQCQHAGWYFVPWHRGYLAAFEAVVAGTVAKLGGPADWALPYWNYLDATKAQSRRIPQAFLVATLPDGSPNPLAQAPRHGTKVLGPTSWLPRDISLSAMSETIFTAAQGTLGFGGGATGFLHFASANQNLTGAVEGDPHNPVHVMIGGLGQNPGWMSDPDFAARDPIFWLHHCNVDRLWAAWLGVATNQMEQDVAWADGPSPRRFAMPDPSGQIVEFEPSQTLPGGPLAPQYDDLTIGTGIASLVASAASGGPTVPASVPTSPPAATLAGSNDKVVTVGASPATTLVRLAPAQTRIAGAADERVFLNLENVRGTAPSGVLEVFVNVPAKGAVPAGAPEPVETVVLFGLAKASAEDGGHGGNGLTLAIDITKLARSLDDQSALDQLEVRIEQPEGADTSPITVDRVSVFRQPAG